MSQPEPAPFPRVHPQVWAQRLLDLSNECVKIPGITGGFVGFAAILSRRVNGEGVLARFNTELSADAQSARDGGTVSRYLKALTSCGLLRKTEDYRPARRGDGTGGAGHPAEYVICWPEGASSEDLKALLSAALTGDRQRTWRVRQKLAGQFGREALSTPEQPAAHTPPSPSRTGGGQVVEMETPPGSGRGGYPVGDGGGYPSQTGSSPYRGFSERLGMAEVVETGTTPRRRAPGTAFDSILFPTQTPTAPTSPQEPPAIEEQPPAAESDGAAYVHDQAARIREAMASRRAG